MCFCVFFFSSIYCWFYVLECEGDSIYRSAKSSESYMKANLCVSIVVSFALACSVRIAHQMLVLCCCIYVYTIQYTCLCMVFLLCFLIWRARELSTHIFIFIQILNIVNLIAFDLLTKRRAFAMFAHLAITLRSVQLA